MASVDSYNNIHPVPVLNPKVYTSNQNPGGVTGFNLQGYESATFVIQTGVITDGTWTLKFQSSPTGGTGTWSTLSPTAAATGESNIVPVLLSEVSVASALPVAKVPGPFDSVGSSWNNQCFRVGYVGQNQFIRMLMTESGASSGGLFSSVLELGCPHFAITPPNVGYST